MKLTRFRLRLTTGVCLVGLAVLMAIARAYVRFVPFGPALEGAAALLGVGLILQASYAIGMEDRPAPGANSSFLKVILVALSIIVGIAVPLAIFGALLY